MAFPIPELISKKMMSHCLFCLTELQVSDDFEFDGKLPSCSRCAELVSFGLWPSQKIGDK